MIQTVAKGYSLCQLARRGIVLELEQFAYNTASFEASKNLIDE